MSLRPEGTASIIRAFAENRMAVNHAGSAIAKWVFDEFGWYDSRLLRSQDYGFFKRVIFGVDITCTNLPLIMYRANKSTTNWTYFWECGITCPIY